jgi:hypothetical protein
MLLSHSDLAKRYNKEVLEMTPDSLAKSKFRCQECWKKLSKLSKRLNAGRESNRGSNTPHLLLA